LLGVFTRAASRTKGRARGETLIPHESAPSLVPAALPNPIDCGIKRIAVLLVGDSHPSHFNVHSDEMMRFIVNPLRADVFVVVDEAGPEMQSYGNLVLRDAITQVLGPALKGIGLVSSSKDRHVIDAMEKDARNNATKVFRLIPDIFLPPSEQGHGINQWHKLYEAWRMMEAFEIVHGGALYDVVIKLRFDW